MDKCHSRDEKLADFWFLRGFPVGCLGLSQIQRDECKSISSHSASPATPAMLASSVFSHYLIRIWSDRKRCPSLCSNFFL